MQYVLMSLSNPDDRIHMLSHKRYGMYRATLMKCCHKKHHGMLKNIVTKLF